MMMRRALAASLVVGLLCLTACSGSGSQLALEDGTAVFVGTSYSGDVAAIGISGIIVKLDGGCWGLDQGVEGTAVLAFEHGTEVSSDGTSVVPPNGVELRPGDKIFGGSAFDQVQDRELTDGWAASYPDCFAGRDLTAISGPEVTATAQ